MEIKAKCIQNYSTFEKGKLYKMIKEDITGVQVYMNKYDYVTFAYCDYTFFFMDVQSHRENLLDNLLRESDSI